ncbi:hypothetical protein ABZ446_28675 [Streptomyces sp. NPDC005813]|uniref:hypothetical protein n=1 Tax=Streptomyces sp. NPDC005813 TaxID=3155592 RepID=UPI0033C2D692
MKRETYKGRKIKVVAGRGAEWGYTRVTLNGVDMGKSLGNEDEALTSTRSYIDHADEVGVSSARYGAEWYAPGSYELCEHGHVMPIGGECGHQYCVELHEEVAPVVEELAEEPTVVKVDAPSTTCPALAEQGNIHLMTAHCVECNAFRMSKMNVDTVEQWYRSGHFSQAEYEAYMYAWATSAYRYGATDGWAEEPTDPEVIRIVAAIRRHARLPAPAELTA